MAIFGGGLAATALLGGAAVGAGVSALSKKGGGGASSVEAERIDMEELTRLAREQALSNIEGSIDTEKKFTPEIYEGRREAMRQLLGDIQSGGAQSGDLQRMLMEQLGEDTDMSMPELESSGLLENARAMAMRDLEMGGELSPELRNLIARESAGRASGGGFLGGQIGRDISARDLGLTSFDIRNQRINRAAELGAGEEATNLVQQGLAANILNQNRAFKQTNLLNISQQIAGLRQNEFANRFGMAQFTQGIEQPIVGLDPGQLASAYIGDINMLNQVQGQNLQAQMAKRAGDQALFGGLLGTAGTLGGAAIMACWVAREVYGTNNPKWKIFRLWLANHSNDKFFNWYMINGESFAKWLKGHTWMKPMIRAWMDKRVKYVVDNGIEKYGDGQVTAWRRFVKGV